MSLLKLPLLLSSSISFHIALYTPYFSKSEDKVMGTSIRERIWRYAALPSGVFLECTTLLAAVAESMVIISALEDTPWSSDTISRILDALGPTEASKLTPSFVFGALLVTVGGILRGICIRTLGPYFTVQQCIRKEHRLITTGPYAVVRHPSYTCMLVCLAGSCLMYGSSDSWLRTSGLLDVPWVRTVSMVWCMIVVPATVTLVRRGTEEDQFLSEKFGKEWESWAKKVKYKLVPFVY